MPGEVSLLERPRIVSAGFGGQLQEVIPALLAEEGFPSVSIDLSNGMTPETLEIINSPHTVGITLSGGHDSVHREGSPKLPQEVLERGVPILGNCFGEQLLADALGGTVSPGTRHELGRTSIELVAGSRLFNGIPETTIGLMSHRDVVTQLPLGAVLTGKSQAGIAAFELPDRHIYGVQWHPESPQSVHGRKLMTNFAELCGLEASDEVAENYIDNALDTSKQKIIEAAQNGHVSIFLSGGVDSAVAAALIYEILTEQGLEDNLTITYVDTGTMRYNDMKVIELLQKHGLPVDVRDMSDLFLDTSIKLPFSVAQELGYSNLPKMIDVSNGDQLRKLYKYGFLQVQDMVAKEIRAKRNDPNLVVTFVQGTNAADRAESGTKGTDQIKEHHNSGVEEHVDALIEPLEKLFKGQIRRAGTKLGLPVEVTGRQPFPGPGLGLRVITQNKASDPKSDLYKLTSAQLEEFTSNSSFPRSITASLAPVTARGVRGDQKFDGYAVLLRGDILKNPDYWNIVNGLSIDIGNHISTVARVGALIVPNSAELSPVDINVGLKRTRETYKLLDNAEKIKDEWLAGLENRYPGLESHFISQHFMSLVDHGMGLLGAKNPMAWLRLFQSGGVGRKNEDMMTGNALIPGFEEFPDISMNLFVLREILLYKGLAGLVYDITHKPYGATEWI